MVAREALRHQRRNNMRHILYNERMRVENIIARQGGSYIDHRPSYINKAIWKSLCDYWASPTFKRRSWVARTARLHHVTPRTSNGIPFRHRSRNIQDKGEELSIYDQFVRRHTKKNTKESISEVVPDLMGKLTDSDNQNSSSDSDDNQPNSFPSSHGV